MQNPCLSKFASFIDQLNDGAAGALLLLADCFYDNRPPRNL